MNVTSNNSIKPGQSIRARGGSLRIQYDPEWSPSAPFITFKNGTAGKHCRTLIHAIDTLTQRSARWTDWA